ncbi:hypothetical protein BgiMline_020067 [Biomphalaria glabrata]|nr:hypothetical protein BgiMline_029776 [Biomphalaria glabrata]
MDKVRRDYGPVRKDYGQGKERLWTRLGETMDKVRSDYGPVRKDYGQGKERLWTRLGVTMDLLGKTMDKVRKDYGQQVYNVGKKKGITEYVDLVIRECPNYKYGATNGSTNMAESLNTPGATYLINTTGLISTLRHMVV